MSLYDAVADLPLVVESTSRSRREADTSSGFARVTTTFALSGEGVTGRGEDVTYAADDHDALADAPADAFDLVGEHTLDSLSAHLDDVDLFPGREPERETFRDYRRWAVESAALDLALRQAGTDLGSALGRDYDPVRFVVSTRLGDPPTADRVHEWLSIDADLGFKLDATSDWDDDLVAELAATDAVRIVDLKGAYEGTDVDQAPDPDLYERVVGGFPDAAIEDPALTDETRPVVAPAADRVSWDAPVHSLSDFRERPLGGRWLNVKPSRFGSVASLLETVEWCLDSDVTMYSGGQFELGVGRAQLHELASLFYPDAPNDAAPRAYNEPEPSADVPSSPLAPDVPLGFGGGF
ncbi:MAG: hypothetical protein ABEJ04_01900 [Halobacteriaceae archaeon]